MLNQPSPWFSAISGTSLNSEENVGGAENKTLNDTLHVSLDEDSIEIFSSTGDSNITPL